MSFITINNIWQEYGDHVVLERLNLQVKEGEFCSMVGASGCGKSTFLRLLLGQEAPSRGVITLDGKPLRAEPDSSRGVVFQRYSVFPHLSVLDNVAIGLELPQSPLFGRLFGAKKRAVRERSAEMLEKVGLGHALDKYPAQLSGGMQQRLAIAQAFIMQPRVLLLDEPTKGMDGAFKAEFGALLRTLCAQGTAVCIVSHDVEFCAQYADHCGLLFRGEVVTENAARAFFSGNYFYTTAAARIARTAAPGAVLCGEVVQCLTD